MTRRCSTIPSARARSPQRSSRAARNPFRSRISPRAKCYGRPGPRGPNTRALSHRGRARAHRTHHLGGTSYALGRHGVARERDFAWTETRADSCTLVLRDDERSRAVFRFAFELAIRYAIAGDALAITYMIHNPGTETLPASLGAHPAFAWPIAGGIAKDAHHLTFACDEPEPGSDELVKKLKDKDRAQGGLKQNYVAYEAIASVIGEYLPAQDVLVSS